MLVVAGETIVDLIETPRREGEFRAFTGGGPYNVAKAAAKMGVVTGYLSPISTDSFGNAFAAQMHELGVAALSPRSEAPTGLAIVRTAATGQPSYSFYRDVAADRDIDRARLVEAMPGEASAFYVGGLALADGIDADLWAEFVGSVACPVFVDPNIRPIAIKDRREFLTRLAKVYDAAYAVKLSDEDINWIAPERDAREYLVEIMNEHNVAVGLLTLGSKGARAITKAGEVFAAAPSVETIDTVGAGDCFSAACLASLLRADALSGVPSGDVLADMLNYAVAAAAINCTRAGADAPTHTEITQALDGSPFGA